jgi:alkaline phosphatase D
MAMTPMTRRGLLGLGVVGGVAGLAGSAPAFSRSLDRPLLTHGVQSGDPSSGSAVVWSRADRPSRLWVQVGGRAVRGPVVTPGTDLTGKLTLRGLPAGERVHYSVRAESLDRPGLLGPPVSGSLRTAGGKGVRFVWTGDVVGQGWGIDPAYGGLKIFESMRRRRPDFLLHSGDTVYADEPLTGTVTLPDGRVWRNLVTEEKSKVAETLREHRGQHAYNLLDDAYRRFVAEVPQINQWDDHEVADNCFGRPTGTA